MARRKARSLGSKLPRWLGMLAGVAVLLFAAGEAWKYFASDAGRLLVARTLRLGDRAHVTRIVGQHVRDGLRQAGVPPDSVRESMADGDDGPLVRWRVGLPREGSPTQVNVAIARQMEAHGAEVLAARERPLEGGGQRVTLRVGLGGRPTHEIDVVRPGRVRRDDDESGRPEDEPPARLALVLFGFTEEAAALAREVMRRSETFAVALPAGQEHSREMFAAAREAGREVVVQIPMEPENYPRTTPGPGALLVDMNAGRIQSLTRRYVEQAGQPVAASNLMGGFATQDAPLVTAMFQELKRTGVTFLHVQPAPRSVCRSIASQQGIAYDEPDALLDESARADDTKALDRDWKAALARATERGHLLLMLRATPTSVRWLDAALSSKRLGHVKLVPLSQVVRRPGAV